MSTRRRETTPGKEKRGTSPLNISSSTHFRRSPVPSKTSSPARSPDSAAASSEKHIPNYLKPTLSSSNDFSKQQTGKKPLFIADKPSLARRRSFDKPPSPSRTQKSRVSPSPALRSSSFSGKITNTQKGVPERNLKGSKDAGKQQSSYGRPLSSVKKNSSILAKKNETGSGSVRKEKKLISTPEKVNDSNTLDVPEPEPELETRSEDQESLVSEAEEQIVLIGNYTEKEPELQLQDQELTINTNQQTEGESDIKDTEIVTIDSPSMLDKHLNNILMVESPTVSENQDDKIVSNVEPSTVSGHQSPAILENQEAKIVNLDPSTVVENEDANLDAEIEEPQDKLQLDEISSQLEEIKEQMINVMDNINTDESVAGNPNEEVEDKKIDQQEEEEKEEKDKEKQKEEKIKEKENEEKEEKEKREEEEEATTLNKKEEVDSGIEKSDEDNQKEVEEVVVEEKKEAEIATPKTQVVLERKDSAVSNDVIEETASKLREQRKNKVKALAGAFESVISLQESRSI